jgi:hypothetical protein
MDLAGLQEALGMQGMRAAQGGSSGIAGFDLGSMANGVLPQGLMDRTRDVAYGGLEYGLGQATQQADAIAMQRGVPLSSMRDAMVGTLQQPLLAQANQMYGQMFLQNLQGQRDLFQRYQQNLLSAQESPALSRLLQMRILEAPETQLNMQRFPGGLPDWTSQSSGSSQLQTVSTAPAKTMTRIVSNGAGSQTDTEYTYSFDPQTGKWKITGSRSVPKAR